MERLDAGEVVIGDGGFVFALEKRGYVKAGPWTPEAAAEHPEAGEKKAILPTLMLNSSLLSSVGAPCKKPYMYALCITI